VTPARPLRDRARQFYAPALLAGLLGGVGITVGAARPWAGATSTQPDLPVVSASATGTDLAPVAGALGLVLLAAFGAVIATRGWVRRALGVLILVASVVVLVAVIVPGGATDLLRSGLAAKGWSGGGYTTSTSWWRWLVLVSSLVTAAAGLATAAYGDRWAVMGSRYDAPAEQRSGADQPAEALSESQVWQAIDQGRDPTQGV
jgi:uncharacterized membrane protein (TIGR02234 family)